MELITYLLWLALVGLVVGAVARLIVPGPDPMGVLATMLIGLGGSILAGLVARLIWGDTASAGFILAVVVTAGLVWLLRPRDRTRSPV